MLAARPGRSRGPPLSGQFVVGQRGHRPRPRRQVGGGEQHGQPILEPRKRVKITPFGDHYPTTLHREQPLRTTNHHLSDSAVVLRKKLMHGLPVRVVAVTNVDLKIMLRRTPIDSVLGRRRSPRASGSENASCTTGVGLPELRPPPQRKFGEGV